MKNLLKTIWVMLNVALSALTVFSGFGGYVNPDFTTVGGIALMLFPAFFIACVVVAVVDLFIVRRTAMIPLAAMLAVAVPAWNYCPLNISSPRLAPDEIPLTVMTYNAYNFHDYRTSEITDSVSPALTEIIAGDADIVLLQEGQLFGSYLEESFPSQADSVARLYPHHAQLGEHLSVWSRYPFEAITLVQPQEYTAEFMGCLFDIDGVKLPIVNVHLQSLDLSPDDKALYRSITTQPSAEKLENARYSLISKLSAAMRRRASQARLLAEQLDTIKPCYEAGLIVGGDFNDITGCNAMITLQRLGLKDAFTSIGFGPMITYRANRFYFTIDHQMYASPLRPIAIKRGDAEASDHYPVTVTYALRTIPSTKP